MASERNDALDLDEMVVNAMSGKSGFANTKKLKSLGIDGYKVWLQGQLTERTLKINDPRKRKRAARKAKAVV